jgi:16S rRNA (cytidine1402-2'-O)-methyltransferase
MTSSNAALYVVATPLGNLGDMSPRAIEVLKSVDVIAAEDTRHTGQLLTHFGISTRMISVHDHNEQQQISVLLERLGQGQSIALVSDAGTPLISDPGYRVVSALRDAGVEVIPVPGPSALISALSVAGLPTDRFVFEGFLPAKKKARVERLQSLAGDQRTLVFYESRHRISESLQDMAEAFGGNRIAVIARELTKLHEQIHSAPLQQMPAWLAEDEHRRKGEFVVLVHGAPSGAVSQALDGHARKTLVVLMRELPLKQASKLTAEIHGLQSRTVYQVGLELKSPN